MNGWVQEVQEQQRNTNNNITPCLSLILQGHSQYCPQTNPINLHLHTQYTTDRSHIILGVSSLSLRFLHPSSIHSPSYMISCPLHLTSPYLPLQSIAFPSHSLSTNHQLQIEYLSQN